MFSFEHARGLIDEGYRATAVALDLAGVAVKHARSGIFPQRQVEVRVIRERCIGCGVCASLEPQLFRMDAEGKAVGPDAPCAWSPIAGGFIRHCPTYAITARPAHPAVAASTAGESRGTAPALS